MKETVESIEVEAPVSEVYNQWTQFEQFPQFMEGVVQVQQLDDTHLKWVAEVAGKQEEWLAEIIEQQPDKAIQWRAEQGAENGGAVLFDPIDENRTKVTLKLFYEPEGLAESVGAALGFVNRQVKQDLENFSEFIEDRGMASGAWRGEVHDGQKEPGTGTGGANLV